MTNGNGKWQLAFFLITAISGTWLLAITTGVIANENRNVENHTAIRADMQACVDKLRLEIGGKLDEFQAGALEREKNISKILAILESEQREKEMRYQRKVNGL